MLLLNIRRRHLNASLGWAKPEHKRLLFPAALLILLAQSETRDIVTTVLSDAFWQVSVFVAATLAVYHLVATKVLKSNRLSKIKALPAGQVLFASLLGAIPGCGGAIIVITQYVSGSMSFGAVVAVLTATMGDAAFLLLASEPVTGVGVIALTMSTGVVSGLIVDRIHEKDFLRPKNKVGVSVNSAIKSNVSPKGCKSCGEGEAKSSGILKLQGSLWRLIMFPGAIIGLMFAAQVNFNDLIESSDKWLQAFGALIAVLCIVLWATTTEVTNFETLVAEDKKRDDSLIFQKVALDTNFVTAWVVLAFISFELIIHFTQFDLAQLFSFMPAIAPLAGVIVGMIPGCGPQILTTSLYLSGAIPLSAQIGNAISNDGDALFPAIALSPKVAIWATLYSALPALLISYGYFWLFET